MTSPRTRARARAARGAAIAAPALPACAGIAVLAVLALTACRGPVHAPDIARRYRTVPASVRPFHRQVVASGAVRPVRATVVGAAVSGTVVQVLADFNDPVRKGQVLARLDAEGFRARLAQAVARERAADATLALARAARERQQALEAAGFLSAAAGDVAQGQVDAAVAARDQARAEVRLARADLRNTVVTSPVAGVVLSRRVDRGQTVAAGLQTPDLFVIAQDLDVVQVVAAVRENDVPAMPARGPATLRVDAWPGRVFPGRIDSLRLSEDASQGVVTYPLVVTVPNADRALRPGMSAEVRLSVADPRPRLSVPLAALRWHPPSGDEAVASTSASAPASASFGGGVPGAPGAGTPAAGGMARVWVWAPDAGGRPQARDLVIGAIDGDEAEVQAGPLQAGEPVIVADDEEGHDGSPAPGPRHAAP